MRKRKILLYAVIIGSKELAEQHLCHQEFTWSRAYSKQLRMISWLHLVSRLAGYYKSPVIKHACLFM